MNQRRRPQMFPRPPQGPRKPQARAGHYWYHHPYYPYHWYDYDYDWCDDCDDWYDYDYDRYWDDRNYLSSPRLKRQKNTKPIQSVMVDVPLMIRLFEYVKEDAGDDMALHKIVERMIGLSEPGESLGMEYYDQIIEPEEEYEYTKPSSSRPRTPE